MFSIVLCSCRREEAFPIRSQPQDPFDCFSEKKTSVLKGKVIRGGIRVAYDLHQERSCRTMNFHSERRVLASNYLKAVYGFRSAISTLSYLLYAVKVFIQLLKIYKLLGPFVAPVPTVDYTLSWVVLTATVGACG